MLVVGAYPPFVWLAFLFALGALGLGVYAVLAVVRMANDQLRQGPDLRTLDASGNDATPSVNVDGDGVEPVRSGAGGDAQIRSTPIRLGQLEEQLGAALKRAEQQSDHLRDRRRRIEGKEDRAELIARYDEDVNLLGRRAENMRRVMAMLWRTRAILELRAHIAISARERPWTSCGRLLGSF